DQSARDRFARGRARSSRPKYRLQHTHHTHSRANSADRRAYVSPHRRSESWVALNPLEPPSFAIAPFTLTQSANSQIVNRPAFTSRKSFAWAAQQRFFTSCENKSLPVSDLRGDRTSVD